MPRATLTEARPAARVVASEAHSGRVRVELITPGWGSSGYYSAEVLEAAGRNQIFPAGTHMYLDHPTLTEQVDRPERSLRDLAGVLAETAVWDPTAGADGRGALVAEAAVFGTFRELLTDQEVAEAIGVSLRAVAEVTENGQAEGRRGRIVDELVEARSVDYVTQPGRGGRIVEVLESARPVDEARNIGQWIESRLHRDFTITADDMAGDGRLTREERISLSSAIGDALTAFVGRLEADQPQLYQRDLWDDPQDTVAAAMEAAQNVPATRSDDTTTSEEDTMPQIEEARLRQLEEASGRVPTLESERDAATTRAETAESERDQVRQELAAERARAAAVTHARTRVTEANGELPQATVDRIVERATATVPLTESGQLDTAALDTATDSARTEEEAYVARLAESQGAGTPRWVTTRKQTEGDGEATVSESDVDAMIRRRAGLEQKGA